MPHPSLVSFLFIPSLYPSLFNSNNIFHFLVSLLFLLHACMYSHQVYNSNVGLAPKKGLSTWTKMDGYSYSYLYTLLLCKSVSPNCEICCQVNCLQTCECISASNLYVCEVSYTYLLGCLRY